MKTWIILGVFAAALGGCATAAPDHIDPKGSYPNAGTGNVQVKEAGELVVFGHAEASRFRDAKDTFPRGDADFVVFDESGRRVAEMRGSRREMGREDFDIATLPAGRYLVRAREPHDDLPQVFWVTVEKDGLTAVDVDTWRHRTTEEKVVPVE